MKRFNLILALGALSLGVLHSCTKNTNPLPPPPHDSTGVPKTDTNIVAKLDTAVQITKGLVLFLPFDGNFADSSGLNNTVTAVGGATLGTDLHGYAHNAFNATGSGERLYVTNNGSYKVDSAFTVSLDFMIRSNAYYSGGYNFNGLMTFLSIVNTANGNGPTFNLGMNVPGLPQYFNFGVNTNYAGSDCNSSGAANPTKLDDTTSFSPQLGYWYNTICVFDHGTISVYIDGRLQGKVTGIAKTVLFCPDAQFVIGGWWDGDYESINGQLDDVRFYNRAINANEITYLARNFQVNSTTHQSGIKTGSANR
jgi:hypothetical protein